MEVNKIFVRTVKILLTARDLFYKDFYLSYEVNT